jgi:hypothetical protein
MKFYCLIFIFVLFSCRREDKLYKIYFQGIDNLNLSEMDDSSLVDIGYIENQYSFCLSDIKSFMQSTNPDAESYVSSYTTFRIDTICNVNNNDIFLFTLDRNDTLNSLNLYLDSSFNVLVALDITGNNQSSILYINKSPKLNYLITKILKNKNIFIPYIIEPNLEKGIKFTE